MGLSLLAYFFLAITGASMFYNRTVQNSVINRIFAGRIGTFRTFHYVMGWCLLGLVLLLLAIGIVGTLGHFGSLGHSSHLYAGLAVVVMVLISVGSAMKIGANNPWARRLHVSVNLILFLGFAWVSLTGWDVVQKYLP